MQLGIPLVMMLLIKRAIAMKKVFLLTFTVSFIFLTMNILLIVPRGTYVSVNREIVQNQADGISRNNKDAHTFIGDKWSLLTSYKIRHSKICPRNLTFVVVVHSAVEHFNKRLGIRQTWANPDNYKGFTMKTVFFLGSAKDSSLQYMIEEENARFRDIVQGRFLDTYRNITYKGIMVLKWVSEFCSHAELVIKVDDDVFVNMIKVLYTHLPLMKRKPRQLLCDVVKNGRVMRHKSEKWALAPNELPGRQFYPMYCRGYFVLIKPTLLKELLKKIVLYPFFWIDDVYLFGMLAEFSDVTFIDIRQFIKGSSDSCISSFAHDRGRESTDCCLNIKDKEHMGRIWTAALRKNGGKYLESIVTKYSMQSW